MGQARKPPAKKAARKRAAVAVEEVTPETAAVKSVEWRGLTLELPESMPATITFDFIDLETAGGDPRPILRMLRSIVGPEQFTDVRHEMTADDTNVVAVIDELLGAIFDTYGAGLGE